MEVGSQATPFEHRSFGEELALCQRYYHILCTWYSRRTAQIPQSIRFVDHTQAICWTWIAFTS